MEDDIVFDDLELDEILEIEKICSMKNIVYKFFNEQSELLYVGITNNFPLRLKKHKREKKWFKDINKIYVSEPLTRNEAHIYEIYYISMESPKFNDHFNKGNLSHMNLKELKFLDYSFKK